jgi:hypothetical protein
MLKKISSLIWLLLIGLSVQSQSFGGGTIFGISTSQVGGDDISGFNKAGLLLGIFANRKLSDYTAFQMEITYIQKGSNNPKMNEIDHPNYLKADISMSYIEIPFLIQYQQSEKIKIEGGVQFAWLINGYYNDLSGKIPSENSPFVKNDIGLFVGIDYKYSKSISLNSRIANSIIPIGSEDYNNANVFNSTLKGKYNSVISFALHYNI